MLEGETTQHFLIGLKVAGLVLLGPVFLWFLGWVSVGDDLLLVRWGAYGAPWLALVALFAAGAMFVARARRFAVVATILALLILVPVFPRLNPERWLAEVPADGLRVMTFNASTMNSDFPAIAGLIADEKPDILFLQQLADLPALQRAIKARDRKLQYYSYPEGTFDTLVLARKPLTPIHVESGITGASIIIGNCRLSLWSLHAPHGQYDIDGQRDFFKRVAAAVHNAGPYVNAGGDLNSTEFNTVQAPLREELRDAFEDTGAGFGFTFPSPVRRFGTFGRILRIDYIFTRGMKTTFSRLLERHTDSDHVPVVVTQAMPMCHDDR